MGQFANEINRIRTNILNTLNILLTKYNVLINDGDKSDELAAQLKSIYPNMRQNNNYGSHCDEYGIWHKPDDWDDIESMPPDDNGKDTLYFLVKLKNIDCPYIYLYVLNIGGYTASYGKIYTPGVFTEIGTIPHDSLVFFDLRPLLSSYDYIVIKLLSGKYFRGCRTAEKSKSAVNDIAITYYNLPILMRYGKISNGIMLACRSMYLESDNIIDFAKNYWDTETSVSLNLAYDRNINLQRWRCTGWDLSRNKVSSIDYTFYKCYKLSDVPNNIIDASGWCQASTTSVYASFYGLLNFYGMINTSNWDITNIPRLSNLFAYDYHLSKIIGLETWTKAKNCTTCGSMFYKCYNLKEIDVSSLYLGNGDVSLDTVSSMFACCVSLKKINLNNTNLYNTTSLSTLFLYCNSLTELIWDTNFTGCGPSCVTTSLMFVGLACLKELIFDNWDFTNDASHLLAALTSCNIEKIIFRNCIPPINVTATGNSSFSGNWHLRYLDLSYLDISKFAANSTFCSWSEDRWLIDLYPPLNIDLPVTLSHSFMLSHDSIIRLFNNLITPRNTTRSTITLSSYNLSKLTDAEKQIATDKGWTLA